MGLSLSEERIRKESRRGHWRDETLTSYLDRWATLRPDRIAFVDSTGRLTWGELARAVARVAHGLGAHGVGPGTFISCQLPNWIEFALVFLAAERLGAVINPIPPTYRASELRFMLGLLETSALVIPAEFRGFEYTQMVRALRSDLPRLEHVFVARGRAQPDTTPFTRLTGEAWEDRGGGRSLAGTDPGHVHEVVFTSGTTGEPKGVMRALNTVLSTIYPVIDRLAFSERDVILMASTLVTRPATSTDSVSTSCWGLARSGSMSGARRPPPDWWRTSG